MPAPERSSGPRRVLTRFGLLALGTLVGLVTGELALRCYLSAQSARKAADWRSIGQRPPAEGELGLGHIIRPHPEPRIGYELIPDMDVTFKQVSVRTNAAGFRGPPAPPPGPPAPGTVRILGLGDSVMFGWGVEQEDCYLGVLERMLSEAHPGTRIEVINTAVPGYNTVIEVETFKVKGLAYDPDIVVLDYVNNDLEPPNFIVKGIDCWTLSRSFLLELAQSFLRGERFDPSPRFGMPQRTAQQNRELWEPPELDPQDVPEGLEELVGLGPYQAAMRELADLARVHGFEVVLTTTHQTTPPFFRETCAELGFPLIETTAVSDYMREHGIRERRGAILTLSPADPHPTALVHGFQAEAIFEYLMANRSLQRALERRGAN